MSLLGVGRLSTLGTGLALAVATAERRLGVLRPTPRWRLGHTRHTTCMPPHTRTSHTISSHTRLGSRTSQRKGKGAPVGARTAPHSHTTTPQTAYSGSRYARKSLKCSLLSPPLGNAAFPSGSIHGRVLAAHHHLSHARARARASRLPLSAAPAPVCGLSCAGSPFRSDAQIANASWRPLHAGRTLLLRPPPLSSRLSLIPLSL